ncbi:MAG: methionine--tRNA ligase [Acidobacteria bacterium RBG_16_68_9]|nr:MAG: methionine--tRNA ligase [Acidobacteria bacterium RBG_16_68_9]
MRPVYITTPIYYINAEPHLGHTYTTVLADTVARFCRERGHPTFFLTGTDEHGDKIAQAAAAAGVLPQAHADRVSGIFRDTWDACGIRYDHFIRTTDPVHRQVVQEFCSRLHASGDIYFDAYRGLYCVGCERLLTEKELVDGRCPDHLVAPTMVDEPNYFFRMSKYQKPLIAHLEAHPNTIVPPQYRNEVLALLRGEALGDLCISRPRSRLAWGIELPFDRDYVAYVWVDALVNYLSALKAHGEDCFQTFWPYAQHLIAKDILKQHGIFWPTLLMAVGLPLFRQLHVHGYWTRGASKMSKSLGNVIRPLDMKQRFGMDTFRYFLLREMAFGQDALFSEDAFVTRVNADLANNLGNLVSRTLAMQQRYFSGTVQPLGVWTAEDSALAAAFGTAIESIPAFTEQLAFHRALESLWRAIDHANKYIVITSPFTLAKDPTQRQRVGAILHHLLEGLYVIAVSLKPFLPETAVRLLGLLNLPAESSLSSPWQWGGALPAGHETGKPEILFPRIEATAAEV